MKFESTVHTGSDSGGAPPRAARRLHHRLRPCAWAVLLALAGPAQAVDFRYVTTVWTRAGLLASEARGLNDAGVAVGIASLLGGLPQSAFTSSGTTLVPFNVPLQITLGYDINNAGAWVGRTTDVGNGQERVFIRERNTTTYLPGFGTNDASPAAINAAGMVVGWMETGAGSNTAFLWDGSSMRFLPTLGGAAATATSLNDAGEVAGWSFTASGDFRATLWRNGSAINLGTLGGPTSVANGINNLGTVVGNSRDAGNTVLAFMMKRNGTMQSLGLLGDRSSAEAVNDFDLAVGNSAPAIGTGAAFVAGAQGMHNLNDHLAVAPNAQELLVTATDINRQGQIVARNVAGFAVLLTPQGTLRWTASGDGDFVDGGAWDSGVGQGPSSFLDLVLAHPASQVVELSRSAEARSLVIGAAGGAEAGQMRLRLSAGAVLGAAQGIVVERSGTLTGDGTLAANVRIAGTLQAGCGFNSCQSTARLYQDSRYTFDVASGGLITGSGVLEAEIGVDGGGEVRAGAGQSLRLLAPGGTHISNGTLEVRDGGTVRVGGVWQNRLGTVRIDGGSVRFDDGLDNQSQVQIGFGGADIYGSVDNRAGARIIASGGNQTTFWDAMRNNGEVRASAGSQLVYFGPVNGAGSFTTNGAGAYHRFEGGYSPGNSPSDVELGTTQLASTLTMEVGGTQPGTQHDRITFTGLLTLDAGAELDVVLIEAFMPQDGQVFDLFAFQQGVQGVFQAVHLPVLQPGLVWDASALYTAGDLRVSAVPEPSAWVLLAGGMLMLAGRRRFGAA